MHIQKNIKVATVHYAPLLVLDLGERIDCQLYLDMLMQNRTVEDQRAPPALENSGDVARGHYIDGYFGACWCAEYIIHQCNKREAGDDSCCKMRRSSCCTCSSVQRYV